MRNAVLTLTLALVAAAAVAQAPANDECVNATTVFDGINPGAPAGASGTFYSNVGGTNSAGASSCLTANPGTSDVWFTYTATYSGLTTFCTCTPPTFTAGTLTDTEIEVYTTCGGTRIGCDDDACTLPGFGSSTTVTTAAGTSYIIRVSTWSSSTTIQGTFYLTISPDIYQPGEDCATATPLPGDGKYVINSTGRLSSAPTGVCASFAATDVDMWYTFVNPLSGPCRVFMQLDPTDGSATNAGDTSGANRTGVYDGTSGCGTLTNVLCTTSTSGTTYAFNASLSTLYYIRLGLPSTSTAGPGTFSLRCVLLPSNDECATATTVNLGLNGPFSSFTASTSATTQSCLTTAVNDLWFSFTPANSGLHAFHTCGSGANTVMTIYNGCGGSEVACDNDDASNLGPCATTQTTMAYIQTTLTAGATYLVRIGSTSTSTLGDIYLTIDRKFDLQMDQSVGPMSFVLANHAGNPGNVYITALTLNQGLYPGGWYYGVDIPVFELLTELTYPGGVPFFGALDGSGESNFTIPPFSVPPGLTLYAVSVQYNVLTGVYLNNSQPKTLTTL